MCECRGRLLAEEGEGGLVRREGRRLAFKMRKLGICLY